MSLTYRHIETVDSTNAYLQRLQGNTEIDGFVVWADEQTTGRGMGSNSWESAPAMNLTFSLALRTDWLPATDQFLLSQLVPLALLDVLDTYLPAERLQLKWPNDLYFDGHKLGGILISNTLSSHSLSTSIIGIGLNVNQTQFADWPTHPISMRNITSECYTLEPFLHQIVDHLAEQIAQAKQSVTQNTHIIPSEASASSDLSTLRKTINERYYTRLYRYHQWADYEAHGHILRLFMTGIDPFGRLQLIDHDQQQYLFDIKEVRFV